MNSAVGEGLLYSGMEIVSSPGTTFVPPCVASYRTEIQ
jgi:hypothetical protein